MTTDTEHLIKKVKRKVGSDFEKNEKLINLDIPIYESERWALYFEHKQNENS